MKKVSKNMVLIALLTLATLAPAEMGAFSFSLVALKDMTSSYFANTSNYFSNLFSRFSSQMPGGIKQFSTGQAFLEKSPATKTFAPKPFMGEKKVDPITFKLEPKKTIGKYQKAGNTKEKEITKQFLWEGDLAPDKVVSEINKAIGQMRKNGIGRTELTFNHGRLELIIKIVREKTSNFFMIDMIISEVLEKSKPIGRRWFPIKFEQIQEKNGTSYERVKMTPGEFCIQPAYRQHGIGNYLFSLQNAFLKSQKYALGIIHPFPYGLIGDDRQDDLLPTLCKYYEGFGFIKHPIQADRMFIFFKNGKLDPAMDLFKAIYKSDTTTIEKLIDNGLSLDTIIDNATVAETAIDYALRKNKPELLNILITHGALKDPKNMSLVLDYVLRENKPELLNILITHGALKDPKNMSSVLDYVLRENKTELLNILITHGALKDPKNMSLVLDYVLRENKPELLNILITHGALKDP